MESIDLSGGDTGATDDPFAEVPSDPALGSPSAPIDLSQGPEEERLGGEDAPPPEEPAEGEFMEDPEEPAADEEAIEPPEPTMAEDLTGEQYEASQHEAAAEAAGEQPDISGEVPAEQEAEAVVEEPPADPPTPVEEPPPPPEEPEPAPPADPEPEPTPTPEPDPPPPPAEEPPKAKGKSPTRTYHVLQAEGKKADVVYREVTTVEAHNGEGAIRKAYRDLFPDAPETEVTLVVVPESMWKPKPVKGRAKSDVAIDIG